MPVRDRYSDRVPVVNGTKGASMAKQSFKDECDVNKIVKQYNKTGLFVHLNDAVPSYNEFTTDDVDSNIGNDFHEAMNFVREASEAFNELPAELRMRFDNDPGTFLQFVDDPANREEAIELGLLEGPEPDVTPADTPREPDPPAPDNPAETDEPAGPA